VLRYNLFDRKKATIRMIKRIIGI
jgi:hypothetical protein